MGSDRRSFVKRSLGGVLGAVVVASEPLDGAPPGQADAWLEAIAHKKHRTFLDVGTFTADLGTFRRARAMLNAFRDAYATPDAECGVAFGCHGSALGYLVGPTAWDSLGLVEMIATSRPTEAAALRAATRNWGTVVAERVAELQQRGMKFLACRNTVTRWAASIAEKRGAPAEGVANEIIAGLHAGVEPVPAMIAAAVLAQERGLAYVNLGG